jgi:hypothetical protein
MKQVVNDIDIAAANGTPMSIRASEIVPIEQQGEVINLYDLKGILRGVNECNYRRFSNAVV